MLQASDMVGYRAVPEGRHARIHLAATCKIHTCANTRNIVPSGCTQAPVNGIHCVLACCVCSHKDCYCSLRRLLHTPLLPSSAYIALFPRHLPSSSQFLPPLLNTSCVVRIKCTLHNRCAGRIMSDCLHTPTEKIPPGMVYFPPPLSFFPDLQQVLIL